jgi:hypothetical protein
VNHTSTGKDIPGIGVSVPRGQDVGISIACLCKVVKALARAGVGWGEGDQFRRDLQGNS